jgi:hypothetical protein
VYYKENDYFGNVKKLIDFINKKPVNGKTSKSNDFEVFVN